MQPTLKIRLKKVDSLYKGDPFLTNSYGEMFVLQQWVEVENIVNTAAGLCVEQYGEWRDIPIEVEE